MDAKIVGKKIKELRQKNNMTQKELASKLNVIDKTVSRWECGYGLPDLAIIPEIAAIFNTSIEELLGTSSEIQGLTTTESLAEEQTRKDFATLLKNRRLLIGICSVFVVIVCVVAIVLCWPKPKPLTIDSHCWYVADESDADYVFITAFGAEECMSLELWGDDRGGDFFCQETWRLGSNQEPVSCAVHGQYIVNEGKIHFYSEEIIDTQATNKLRLNSSLGLDSFAADLEYTQDGDIAAVVFSSTVKNTKESVFGRWTKYANYFSREKGEVYFERVYDGVSYDQVMRMPAFVAMDMGVVVPYRLEAYLDRYDYFVGEVIDAEDLKVSLVYSDGTKTPVEDFYCEQVGRELTVADVCLNVHHPSEEINTMAVVYINVKYGFSWERLAASEADYKYFTHYNTDETISFGLLELFGNEKNGRFIYSESYGVSSLEDSAVVTGRYKIKDGEIHFISSAVFTGRNYLPKFYMNSEGDYFTANLENDMSLINFRTGPLERNMFGHYVTDQKESSFSDTPGMVQFETVEGRELSDRARDALEQYKSMYK